MIEFVSSCRAGWRLDVVVSGSEAYVVLHDRSKRIINRDEQGYYFCSGMFLYEGTLRVKAPSRVVRIINPATEDMAKCCVMANLSGKAIRYEGTLYAVDSFDNTFAYEAPYGTAKLVRINSDA